MSTNKKVEKSIIAINWQELHIPCAYASQYQLIAMRLEKTLKSMKAGRDKNYLEKTIKIFGELVQKLDIAYTPKPPKKLEDAHAYALSRNYKGTFFALLDIDDNLVKVAVIKRGEILPTIPKYTIEDTKIQVSMTQHLLKVPELDIERSVPKRVVKVVPFASDKTKIVGYGAE